LYLVQTLHTNLLRISAFSPHSREPSQKKRNEKNLFSYSSIIVATKNDGFQRWRCMRNKKRTTFLSGLEYEIWRCFYDAEPIFIASRLFMQISNPLYISYTEITATDDLFFSPICPFFVFKFPFRRFHRTNNNKAFANINPQKKRLITRRKRDKKTTEIPMKTNHGRRQSDGIRR
jgi:hypothetical protein